MARRKKGAEDKKGGGESGTGRWMLTYLDMVTLLFGVFVLLYAMSQVDAKKYDEVAEALKQGFQGGSRSIFNFKMIGGNTIIERLQSPGTRVKHRFPRIYDVLRTEIEQNIVNVHEDERGLVISLAGDVFFDSGTADLTDDARLILDKLMPVLQDVRHDMRVEGYTDDVPITEADIINKRHYTDNWELAAMRSINVVRYMIDSGVEKGKLSAQSFAENNPLIGSKFLPKIGTPEARALNRRVDIVIMTDPRAAIK